MNKETSLENAMAHIKSSMTIMSNGFMGVKSAETIIDAMVDQRIANLTLISTDSAVPGQGAGKLIGNRCVRKLYASHIGLNPETGAMMNSGEIEVELIPQGTLAERIRCGGSGLGGVLTLTGIGTEVEKGKQKINVDGKDYLLELPLHADVAIIKGSVCDRAGNVYYRGTSKNFSTVMAMAADYVIVETDEIVEIGDLSPEQVMTSGIFVDSVVLAAEKYRPENTMKKEYVNG
jgi:acetate CoA/acetoacetate CoA-transferase alpha subunit